MDALYCFLELKKDNQKKKQRHHRYIQLLTSPTYVSVYHAAIS